MGKNGNNRGREGSIPRGKELDKHNRRRPPDQPVGKQTPAELRIQNRLMELASELGTNGNKTIQISKRIPAEINDRLIKVAFRQTNTYKKEERV